MQICGTRLAHPAEGIGKSIPAQPVADLDQAPGSLDEERFERRAERLAAARSHQIGLKSPAHGEAETCLPFRPTNQFTPVQTAKARMESLHGTGAARQDPATCA